MYFENKSSHSDKLYICYTIKYSIMYWCRQHDFAIVVG